MIIRPRIIPVVADLSPARVGVAGHITVTKRDRDGRRVPVRVDRNRRAYQRIWEHHQPNLITNAGLDKIGDGSVPALLEFIAVGTGSGAPDVADTELDAEAARTSSSLGVATSDYTAPTTGTTRYTRGIAFDFGEANGNLTEFGGFSASSGGSANTRELFRDEFGDPVTITKTSAEQLVIEYGIDVTQSPTSMTAVPDVTYTDYGTFEVEHMFYRGYNSLSGSYIRYLHRMRILPMQTVGSTYAHRYGGSTGPSQRSGINPRNWSNPGTAQTMEDYVGASYKRTMQTVANAGTSDVTYNGFVLHVYVSNNYATVCGFRFTSPTGLVHGADYRLTLNAEFSWARADEGS